jgi:hypothetical protein
MAITDSLVIDASGLAGGLTIDASDNDPTPDEDNGDGSRIFNIDDGDSATDFSVELRSLTLTGERPVGDAFLEPGSSQIVHSIKVLVFL